MKLKYIAVVHLMFFSLVLSQESPHGILHNKCIDCHSTEGWNILNPQLKFNHSTTSFVLYGRHQDVLCKQCHTDLRFAQTPSNCVSCHRHDFDNAVLVDHRKAGFNTECIQCHNVRLLSWESSFDHNKTEFQTRGIHEAVACNQCHVNGIYKGTSSECVSCHLNDYNQTTTPNHLSAHFPTDCATCHRALTWRPAAFFPHDQYFPIGAGATHHPGRWNTCQDCHTTSPNYSSFECIECHEHSKSSTDRHHREVNGYTYLSSACYRCHSRGGGGD